MLVFYGIIPVMGVFKCEHESCSGHCKQAEVLTSLDLPFRQGYEQLGSLLIAGMKFRYLQNSKTLPALVICNESEDCTEIK